MPGTGDTQGRVGRPEVPVDPAAGPVARFACALRALREQAGSPTYGALARRSGLSASVLSEATRGRKVPTWGTAQAFVLACGGDPRDWRQRWEAATDQPAAGPLSQPEVEPVRPIAAPGEAADGSAHPADQEPAARRARGSHRRRLVAVGAAAALAVLGATTVARLVPAKLAPPAPAGSHAAPAVRAASSPSESPAADPSVAGGAPTGAWRKVAGPGCGSNVDGAQVDVDKGWSSSAGGWTGSGCRGTSVTTPLSNSATWWNLTVGWTFEPGASGAPATCELAVYIPDSPDAAGTATYVVLGRNVDNLPDLPHRVRRLVEQASHRGTWVNLGAFDFPEGVVNLELYNVGTGTSRIAADAAVATCK